MKNLVKFTVLAVAILGTASAAGAQASKSTTLTATAAVATDIAVAGSPLNFGTAYRSEGAHSIAANVAGSGSFLVTGTAGSSVGTTFPSLPTDLLSGATTLPVTWVFATIASNAACTTGTVGTGTVPSSLTLGVSGDSRICIGGTVTPAVGQLIASYTGTINITVAFP
ncbi:hypothetical protein BH11GEM1_BH11GEM1_00130 [soil metagenome]